MLTHLHIENYAIIEHLDIDLYAGLNTMTGQTGAGKSIVLGALGLLGGAKAEATVIGVLGEQLVVEGEFDISEYRLQGFFERNELDYADRVTIRRVVARNGKHRAFVDTTPVTLALLRELVGRLVDIHSQHETLLVARADFQREVLDAVALNAGVMGEYAAAFGAWRDAQREHNRMVEASSKGKERQEYLAFQIEKLDELKLRKGEVAELEGEQALLANAEDIVLDLAAASAALDDDQQGILPQLRSVISALGRAGRKFEAAVELTERLQSVQIEVRDVASQVETYGQSIVADPVRLEFVDRRLDTIYSMVKRHGVEHGDELIELLSSFCQELLAIEGGDEAIEKAAQKVEQYQEKAMKLAETLSQSRAKVKGAIEKHVLVNLAHLGIKGAKFEVQIDRVAMSENGVDSVRFMFAGGSAQQLLPLEKVASGGEMSRLMLCIKTLVARSLRLGTVIFDEIDTGVSGAVADAMGAMIEQMSSSIQVINITHLAQVASKGEHHFLVYKDRGTHIRKLDDSERLEQIASMLSGAEVTEAARMQAKELLA